MQHLYNTAAGGLVSFHYLDYSQVLSFGLKTSVEVPEKPYVEFIAMFLLAPLIWTSLGNSAPAPETGTGEGQAVTSDIGDVRSDNSRPMVESNDSQLVIRPPRDSKLNMTVLELRDGGRGPASAESLTPRPSRTIEVIVSAP